MKFRIFVLAALVLLVSVGLAFANGDNEAAADDVLVIGMTVPQIDADGFRVNVESAKKVADARGVKFVAFSAQSSADTQLSQIEDMIAQGMDAIIINPTDVNAIGIGVTVNQQRDSHKLFTPQRLSQFI